MFYDLLVHVDLPDESRFVMALGNINNYLAALNGEPCTVVLLANGGAARFLAHFVPEQTPWLHFDLSGFRNKGGNGVVGSEVTGFGVRLTLTLLDSPLGMGAPDA